MLLLMSLISNTIIRIINVNYKTYANNMNTWELYATSIDSYSASGSKLSNNKSFFGNKLFSMLEM